MKKKTMIILVAILIITSTFIFYNKKPAKVVGEYNGNIGGDIIKSNKKAYEIGIRDDGRPVFKDPYKALKQAKNDFNDGFDTIQKQFKLMPVSRYYFKPYKTYGWQVNTNEKELAKLCTEISSFFDIYENSFNKE